MKTFTATITGDDTGDLEIALDEIKRLVSSDFSSGHNSNESGSFTFEIADTDWCAGLPVFYYDGSQDAKGVYGVVDTEGKPMPGWYTGTLDELDAGPFDTKDEAKSAARKN